MMRRLLTIAAILTLVAVSPLAQDARRAGVTLQAAMAAEFIEGNLPKAIGLYERAVTESATDDTLTARALLGLGQALEKAGRVTDARSTYERLIREHADAPESESASRRLAAVQETPPSRSIDPAYAGNSLTIREMELSPDGTMAAYGRLAGSPQNMISAIVVRDLASGTEHPIAEGLQGRVAGLRFSPDGQRIAATMQVSPAGTLRGDPDYRESLVVLPISGEGTPQVIPTIAGLGTPARPYHGFWPVWSPDSRYLPYLFGQVTEPDLEVRVLDVVSAQSNTVGLQPIPNDTGNDLPFMPYFQWSPSSRHLARRVVTGTGPNELHVVDVASGSTEQFIVPGGFHTLRPFGWTDDDRIVVHVEGSPTSPGSKVAMIWAQTGQAEIVCEGVVPDRPRRVFYGESGGGDACLAVSQPGHRLLRWDSATSQLRVRDLAAGTERPLTLGSGEEHMGYLSPDGSTAAFVSNRDGSWALYAADIDEAPSVSPLRLMELDGLPRYLVLAWKGEGFVTTISNATMNLWRVDVDPASGRSTGPAYRLTQDSISNAAPAIAPGGEHVAYISERRAKQVLAVMNADGSNEREVPTPALAGPPSWLSSDTMFVTLFPARGERLRQFVGINQTTSAVSLLSAHGLETAETEHVQFLPATGEISYLTPRTDALQELRARALADGQERVLYAFADASTFAYEFLVSPSGGQVAVNIRTANSSGPVSSSTILIDSGTQSSRTLSETAGALGGWSPDGRYLLFGVGVHASVLDTATDDRWRLVDDDSMPAWNQGLASWSSDGTFIVLAAPSNQVEVRQWLRLTFEGGPSAEQIRNPH